MSDPPSENPKTNPDTIRPDAGRPDTQRQDETAHQHNVTSSDSPNTVTTAQNQSSIPFIQNYRMMHPIGEGGMGAVWLAEQDAPVKRRVAVKVIKQGLDTNEVIARFEAERQALAMMDHPNIAKILDAGSTDSGSPFFVMEYIQGTPLTTYADENSLSTDERLRLFVTICRAVQHAHQKGIIHRDIKPGNVMVSTHDSQPTVKIIDFGLAKAMHAALTDKSLYTTFGMPLGTMVYAGPEQVEGRLHDIDTRSDVFSLGVTLYELLTGSTPIEKEHYRGVTHQELIRLIREEDPPKPSSRLSESGDKLKSISSHRATKPHQLTLKIRGELDWIVMKAIERERGRRYQSASELAEDVERFLRGEPVVAGPPRLGYRLGKFVKRHRMVVSLAAATLLLLIVTTVASLAVAGVISSQNRDLIAQNDEIKSLLTEVEEKNQKVESQNESLMERAIRIEGLAALANQSIGSFLVDLTQDPRMIGPSGADAKRDRLLEAQSVLQQVSTLAAENNAPMIQAKTLLYKAVSDAELGDLGSAIGGLEDAIKLLAENFVTPSADAISDQEIEAVRLQAQAYRNLGYFHQRLGDHDSADSAHERAIDLLRPFKDSDPSLQLELAIQLTYYGEVRLETEEFLSAAKRFDEAEEIFESLVATTPQTGTTLWADMMYFGGMNKYNVAIAYDYLGELDRPREYYIEAVEVYEQLVDERPDQPRNHSRRTRALINLSQDMMEVDEYKSALKIATRALESSKALRQYPSVLEFQFQLVRAEMTIFEVLVELDELPEAKRHARSGLDQIERLRQHFSDLGDRGDYIAHYEEEFRGALK